MHKYIMKYNKDYRVGSDNTKPHGVLLINGTNGEDTAYGEFANIGLDMVECTEEEIARVVSAQL